MSALSATLKKHEKSNESMALLDMGRIEAEMRSVPTEERRAEWLELIEYIEAEMLKLPQVECPLTHRFAPGIYLREIFMPAGSMIIGHQHRTEHFNVILQGRAKVMMDGVMHDVVAPCTIKSEPNVRKILYIQEDMIWQTLHPMDVAGLDPQNPEHISMLENELVIKSQTYLRHQANARLQQSINPVEVAS
jgi:hypothetical protein